jgi:signal transduction histidine kinase
MEPQHAESRPPGPEVLNAGFNGRTSDALPRAESTVTAFDLKAIRLNELLLLTTKIAELTTANRRKDEFLATLSHELRSPLASIQYGIGVLRGQSGPDVAVQHLMHNLIERQARQMSSLAAGLLDIERIASGHLLMQPDRIDLRAVVAKAIETLEPDFDRRNQALLPTWPASSIWVLADASRLEQVFINLLTNASKYTDAGGRISLSLSIESGSAIVRIKDSGIGISGRILPNIFDLYVQADATAARSRSGLGIGLALVRSIVHLHGGSVVATSAGLGHGSEFIVRLPALARTPE